MNVTDVFVEDGITVIKINTFENIEKLKSIIIAEEFKLY